MGRRKCEIVLVISIHMCNTITAMTKETYEFNFDDTPLTSKFEDMIYDIDNLKPEEMTSAELVEFCKLDMIMNSKRNEILNYAAAESIMHISMTRPRE